MLAVMTAMEPGVRGLIPSSPVPRERAALTGLRDAARGKGHSNGLGCAVLEAASRASDALMGYPTLASTIVSPMWASSIRRIIPSIRSSKNRSY